MAANKTDRFEMRISADDRALLERAAKYCALDMADFVRRAAVLDARRTLGEGLDTPPKETA